MLRIVACLVFVLCLCSSEYTPTVRVSQGELKGIRNIFTGQNQYLSIPYAAVSRRFQPPGPPPRWNGVFHATNPFVICAQNIGVTLGSENCTVLNIFTPPNTSEYSGLPVMVFIHGGSFFYGTGSIANYDPKYLVDQGVIVVTVNYRLGILGFLCLGIKEAPGNMGLKDQVASLRWIKENIAAFGGDPERVTIFGESAGAVSVSLHMLSKMARGLFQGVIMQSGLAIAPWAINLDPIANARADAKKFGVHSHDPYELLEAFLKPSSSELLHFTQDSVLHNTYKYSICIESESFDGDEPYITDAPYNLLRSGSINAVPMIMGMNSAEGIFFAGLHNFNTVRHMNKHFSEYLPRVFDWKSLSQKRDIEWKIRRFYFGNRSIMENDITNLIDFYSDTLIGPTLSVTSKWVNTFSNVPVYNYLFSYDGGRNFAKSFMGINVKGVSHADDLFYIFKPASIPLPISEKDKLIVQRMVTMWANFAKTWNPTPSTSSLLPVKWIPSSKRETIYMNIDHKMSMIKEPFRRRAKFWEELYSLYGIDGVAPAEEIRVMW